MGAYQRDTRTASVSAVSAATGAVTATIPAGNFPFNIRLSPAGNTIYAPGTFDNTVSVINTACSLV